MKITIDLPSLKLNNVKFSDGTFIHDGIFLRRLDILDIFEEYFNTLSNVFFQDTMVLNTKTLEDLNLDVDTTTYQLINLLYSKPNKAIGLFLHFNRKYRFDEITESDAVDGFNIDSQNFEIYDSKETLISLARESYEHTIQYGYVLLDIIGSFDELSNYYDVIDVTQLANDLQRYMKSEKLDFEPMDSIDLIEFFIEKYDQDGDVVIDLIDTNGLFNHYKHAEQTIETVESAIEELNGSFGLFLGTVNVPEITSETLYVFQEY